MQSTDFQVVKSKFLKEFLKSFFQACPHPVSILLFTLYGMFDSYPKTKIPNPTKLVNKSLFKKLNCKTAKYASSIMQPNNFPAVR